MRALIHWVLVCSLLFASFQTAAATTNIAIAQFSGTPLGKSIADVVRADLNRVGAFKVQAHSDLLPVPSSDQNVNFDEWKNLGVEHLLIGHVSGSDKGVQRVQYAMCDVQSRACTAPVAVMSAASQLRPTAHQIADAMYEKLSNKRGIFSTRIAYVSSSGRGRAIQYALMIADNDGVNATAVVRSNDPILSPTWSPDARKVAYVSFERGNSAIYLHELASGHRKLISSFRGINGSPAFSPDGRQLVVTLSRSGNAEIYLFDIRTDQLTQLTKSAGIDTDASFLPTGSGVVFTSDRAGKPQVYRMNIDGSAVTQVTYHGKENAEPSWGAGNQLATVQTEKGISRIAVFQNRGAGPVRFVSSGKLDESPSFAPNGAMLLYAARSGGKGVLYVVAADGSVRTQLPTPPGDVREPAWSPFRQR
jgi:TolB protein